jgi:N-acetyl-gamma-glutamyl-phosphate reductase
MNVSIIGVTGYGGIELIRLLNNHPEFNIHSIHSTKEEALTNEYPHLTGIIEKELETVDTETISRESELVFLATPSGVSGKWAEAFMDKDIRIIDLSGDLRLKNGLVYKKWYQKEPAENKLLAQAIYGLSEWNEDAIKNAKWVANPGCYPTAVLLALAPAIIEKAIDQASIIADAKSGLTGAGKVPSRTTHFAEMNENFKIYKVNGHQHTPEIEQQLRIWDEGVKPITFSTHLMPINRGIFATVYANVNSGFNTEKMIELYQQAYAKSPFVRVRKMGQYPAVKEVCGSNYCDIGLNVDERTGRVTIVAVIDNLMKGAAGQAVQNANIMLGMSQETGLNIAPVYP